MTITEPRFDETIHPRNRLQICAILADAEAIDFTTVRETLDISESSLSKHVKYLSEAGYVTVTKSRHGSRTRTWLSLSKAGRAAYNGHLAELRRIAGLSAPPVVEQRRLDSKDEGICRRARLST